MGIYLVKTILLHNTDGTIGYRKELYCSYIGETKKRAIHGINYQRITLLVI